MYEHKTAALLPKHKFRKRVVRHGLIAAVITAGSLLVGISGYMRFAHMRLVDAFLDASMILAGMGQVATLTTDGAKLFASFYALMCALSMIAISTVLAAPFIHRLLHTLHLEGKK